MRRYRSAAYRKAARAVRIRAYYRRKALAELIPENRDVYRPRVSADAIVTIKLKGEPTMSFRNYLTPWGWKISPTLAGRKVQQVLLNYRRGVMGRMGRVSN